MHLTSRAAVCSAHHDLHVSVSRTAAGMGSSTFVGALRLSASHPAHVLHPGKAHLTSNRAVCAAHHGLHLAVVEGTVAGLDGSAMNGTAAASGSVSMTGASGLAAIAGAGAVEGVGRIEGAGAVVAAGAGSGTAEVVGAVVGSDGSSSPERRDGKIPGRIGKCLGGFGSISLLIDSHSVHVLHGT